MVATSGSAKSRVVHLRTSTIEIASRLITEAFPYVVPKRAKAKAKTKDKDKAAESPGSSSSADADDGGEQRDQNRNFIMKNQTAANELTCRAYVSVLLHDLNGWSWSNL